FEQSHDLRARDRELAALAREPGLEAPQLVGRIQPEARAGRAFQRLLYAPGLAQHGLLPEARVLVLGLAQLVVQPPAEVLEQPAIDAIAPEAAAGLGQYMAGTAAERAGV